MLAIRQDMQYDAPHIGTQAEREGPSMALELTILVGTMTGTAQLVAQELDAHPRRSETRVRTAPMMPRCRGVFRRRLFLTARPLRAGRRARQREEPVRVRSRRASRSVNVPIRRDRTRRPDLRRNLLQRRQAFRPRSSRSWSEAHGEIMCTTRARGRCQRKSPYSGGRMIRCAAKRRAAA